MAKPVTIQKLEHGKIITKANFPDYVETWNYVTAKVENLKGDYDVNPKQGNIRVDNTDPEHPVIRFEGNLVGGGGSTSGYTGVVSAITGVELNLSGLTFSITELTYSDGLLASINTSATPIVIATEAYNNV